MARIKIDLPDGFFFSTHIPVRITDINYGGHAGNDTILSIIHEARMQFLDSYGYTELNFAGIGLIMSDVGIEFKGELFYGDTIIASVTASDFTRAGFDIYYKLETVREARGIHQNQKTVLIAVAKTGMVGYDYTKKKVAAIPEGAKNSMQ